ncbi:MAG: putative quinol monooxygenase [Leisingera sp.]
MSEAVIILVKPLPGNYAELAEIITQMVAQVREFPGCLQAETLLAPDREEIAVFQRWTDADALSDYLIWRSKQEDFKRVYALSAEEPDFKSFTLCTPG